MAFALALVLAGDGEVAQAFHGHLFGMAGTADHTESRSASPPVLEEVFAHDLVGLRHDALHRTEDRLALQLCWSSWSIEAFKKALGTAITSTSASFTTAWMSLLHGQPFHDRTARR
jgi:hypothetical protein